GRVLAKEALIGAITEDTAPDPAYIDALGRLIADDTLDPAFRAFALALPSEADLAQALFDAGRTPDPAAIHGARETLARTIAEAHQTTFTTLYDTMACPGPYRPDAKDAGRRALRLKALAHLSLLDQGAAAATLFDAADNMTESLGALGLLIRAGAGDAQVQAFQARWAHDPNTMDKWFAIQIAQAAPEKAVGMARALTAHPGFNWKTPNRFRAVLGALAGNFAGFHDASGAGYDFFADWLVKLDPVNPQTAARMATVFETCKMFDGDRQSLIRDALTRLARSPSRDMEEITSRILAG
ncbi:MAG: aminopeptidase N C-terminal domain-containing protein, partial [Silicimonas sp.]|nr:aminopeptidase N C-terminal domain-containing protein [Silicimonas sp.]